MNFHDATFIKSAAASGDIVRDGLPQIVFSGKSNVGKSSVINSLLNRRNIARISSSPGKTIHINYFLIDKSAYFVDLPGYGYAKVPHSVRDRWASLMESYFSDTWRIALGVMIVDARHRPTGDDVTMARLYMSMHCPFIIVANKIDKVKTSGIASAVSSIRETLLLCNNIEVLPFSAEKGKNKDKLLADIENAVGNWYNNNRLDHSICEG